MLARIRKHLTQLSLANHAPRESPVDPEVNAMCCLAWGKVCKLHEDSLLSTNSHSNGQTHTQMVSSPAVEIQTVFVIDSKGWFVIMVARTLDSVNSFLLFLLGK